MKTYLVNKLRKSVSYFLSFCDAVVPFPEIEVRNRKNKSARSISFIFAVSEQMKISDTRVVANEDIFSRNDYEPGVCHELGHLIDFVQNPRMLLDSFMSRLEYELRADRLGLKLYMLAGRDKRGFYSFFSANFSELFEMILSDRNANSFSKHFKSLIINMIRIGAFVFYRSPKKNGDFAKSSSFCYHKHK